MAYAFDKVMNSLGLTGEDENVTTGTPAPMDSPTSSEGSTGGGEPQQPAQAPAQQNQTNSARAKVMQKNAQNVKAPTDVGKMQNQVQQARQGIQNEANAYYAGADDPYEVSNETLQKNIQNYASGNSQDTSWLTAAKTAPSLVSNIDLKTDTGVKDLNLLQNDAGIQQLFRRGQDAEGTAGEAALDAALLRKNQDFQLTRDALTKDYQNLQNEKNDLILNAQGKAQDIRNKAQTDYANRINDIAGKELGQYDQHAKESEQKYYQGLDEAEKARRGNIQTEVQSVVDQFKKDHPELASYVSAPTDVGQFYQSGNIRQPSSISAGNEDSWMNFMSGDDAAQFNRIMSILNGGQTRQAGSMAGVSPSAGLSGGLDRNALAAQLLKTAEGERSKKKAADDAEAVKKRISEDALRRTQEQYTQFDQEAADRQAAREAADNAPLSEAEMMGRLANPLASLLGAPPSPGQILTEKGVKGTGKVLKNPFKR